MTSRAEPSGARRRAPAGAGTLGILGGTFDPVHYGHLRLALEAREQLGLERVHLIPAGAPVHRPPPVASARQRHAMLGLALANAPELVLDGRELERRGPSFMVDTLTDLRGEYPDRSLCLLLGMDAFAGLETWRRWPELLELAHLAVARRPGAGLPRTGRLGELLDERRRCDSRHLHEVPSGHVVVADVPALDISSTRIRALLAERRSARFLLPDAVLEFIRCEDLYADAK